MFWIFKSYLDIAPSKRGSRIRNAKKKRTMKKVDFLKTPKLGDIIKVYESSGYYFGVCKGTTYVDRLITRRQVAIVERVMDTYSLTECNFCLESDKVVEL